MKNSNNNFHRPSSVVAFSVVILALIISIIGIEIITSSYSMATSSDILNKGSELLLQSKNHKEYDTSHLTFTSLTLNADVSINSLCQEGCNLSILLDKKTYQFILNKNVSTGEYFLDLVSNNKAIFEDKNLGKDISSFIISKYQTMFIIKGIINDNYYLYDNVLIIDANRHDEIASLEANELEVTDDGIIYYYDDCSTKSKVKVIRKPFSSEITYLSSEPRVFTWCQ